MFLLLDKCIKTGQQNGTEKCTNGPVVSIKVQAPVTVTLPIEAQTTQVTLTKCACKVLTTYVHFRALAATSISGRKLKLILNRLELTQNVTQTKNCAFLQKQVSLLK